MKSMLTIIIFLAFGSIASATVYSPLTTCVDVENKDITMEMFVGDENISKSDTFLEYQGLIKITADGVNTIQSVNVETPKYQEGSYTVSLDPESTLFQLSGGVNRITIKKVERTGKFVTALPKVTLECSE